MALALEQASLGAKAGEVPVGAVVVHNGQLVASAHNHPIGLNDPCAHAEVLALRQAGQVLHNYRLEQCEVFVTLEPCAMCAQALLHARVKRVVFAAFEPKMGAAGSVLNLFDMPALNHHTVVQSGVLADEAAELMRVFFEQRRASARAQAMPLMPFALRTPEAAFQTLWARWPQASFWGDKGHNLTSLPSLGGLNLHYRDSGGAVNAPVWVALHSPQAWWPQWADWARDKADHARVLLPDLVGFGQSDKPKKESWHRPEWHARVLIEWLEALDVLPVLWAVTPDQADLVQVIRQLRPDSMVSVEVLLPQPPVDLPTGWENVPYPDRGHRAACRAWPGQ
jgi:tRNA(Arg) A34 adenosine deaminase TadA